VIPYANGQLFESYNRTTEETRTYELISFEDPDRVKGARCRLRNVVTDGVAEVTVAALSRKPGPSGSHWRRAGTT
jgi:hypothetical protein